MANIPDFIPDTEAPGTSATPGMPSQQAQGSDFIPDDQFVSDEDKYGTPLEQAKAGLEGVARGVAGPLATLAERHVLGAKAEDIRGREHENPITAGAGELAGLVGSSALGVGEGALMTKVGELASGITHGAETANVAKSYISKVGSSAVQQAAEMAVLQSGNEAHKMLINDPDTSAESAIANIGLASALGGATGAFVTGAVSPLWKATLAQPLEKSLGVIKDHLNGVGKTLPEDMQAAAEVLGINTPDTVRGANVSPSNAKSYNDLKRMENTEILEKEQQFHKDISDKVAESLGMKPEEVTSYSENEEGHNLYETFQKEYTQKHEPFEAKYKEMKAETNKVHLPDDARLSKYDSLIQKGINTVGTDSPYYKLYDDYANRLLAKDTLGGVDSLVTEINGTLRKAYREGDSNVIQALSDIKGTLREFQENQISKQATEAGNSKLGAEFINQRNDLNRQYAEFAKMSDQLQDHLGVGSFKGAKTLEGKLADKISPEDLLKKFSFKGNQDFVPFLEKYFPETLRAVRQNELRNFIKPAVLSAKGENVINVKKLGDILDKAMAGKKDYLESILPPAAIEKIQAAQKLQGAIPGLKDSGTPAGLLRNLANMPASAMAMISAWTGHNPILGGIAGHFTHYLGREMPDAIKLGLLKFSAADQPIKAEGFRAMVDFAHNAVKGENAFLKATSNVFEKGAKVIAEHNMPAKADNEKLDKLVTKSITHPDSLMQAQNGQTGHYLPAHQVALTATTVRALQYLQTLKPKEEILGPLDAKVPASPSEEARYNRALTIANNPLVVLQHVKDGTVQTSDITDLKSMYPSLYASMCKKMTNNITGMKADHESIPYKTRIGASLFLGQPLDASMTPQNIMAAQPKGQPQQGPQPQGKPKGASMKELGKSGPSYATPLQASEAHRANKKD